MDTKDLGEIAKARDVIRRKFNAFRHGERDTTEELEKQFKPITEPLKAILQTRATESQMREGDGDEAAVKLEPPPGEADTVKLEHGGGAPVVTDELHASLEKKYGPRVASYLHDKLAGGKHYDDTYGVRMNKARGWMLGNQQISFDSAGKLIVRDEKFDPEPGFLELIFKKSPRSYTERDKENYRRVLTLTSGHRQSYDEDGRINSSRAVKYKNVIRDLFPPKSESRKRGSGLFVPHAEKSERVYVYWDDPNELVARLALLEASKSAGHTGHDREILSIVEELREGGFVI